jgi:hypothetical protein
LENPGRKEGEQVKAWEFEVKDLKEMEETNQEEEKA